MAVSQKVIHAGTPYAHYFIQTGQRGPEYYAGEQISEDEQEDVGYFYGEGAKVLGLDQSPIRRNDSRLDALFQARHPDTWLPLRKGLTNRKYGNKVYKPVMASDLVCSVPSDVAALFGAGTKEERQKIQVATECAAKVMREYVERKYCYTRTGTGGKNREKAKPIWASFTHIEDRAGMPQPHVHNVLFSTVIRQDGKGGAADLGPLLKRETIFELGQLFRDSLRGHLSEIFQDNHLQFPVVPIKNGHSFTIKAHGGEEIPRELCKRYSPRREAILEALEDIDKPTPKRVQVAVLKTRPQKPEASGQAERSEEWRRIAKDEFGFSTTEFLGHSRERYVETATTLAVMEVLKSRAEERLRKTQSKESKRDVSRKFSPPEPVLPYAHKSSPRSRKTQEKNPQQTPIRKQTKAIKQRREPKSFQSAYSYEGALTEAREESRKRAKRLRFKMRFLYYTNQIDTATYKKYTVKPQKMTRIGIEARYWLGGMTLGQRLALRQFSGHGAPKYGVPKSRIGINLSYATGQITREQQLVLLKKNHHIRDNSPEIRLRRSR